MTKKELIEESKDERIRKALIKFHKSTIDVDGIKGEDIIAWLEKQGRLMKALQISNSRIAELVEEKYNLEEKLEKQSEQKFALPKWKYKNDNTPLLRDSLILNKYGCVAKSPSGALVSDVWVMDYDELTKLPKEEIEKQIENNMGISEATKKKLEDNLNKALEKETLESWNEFLEKQGEQKEINLVEILKHYPRETELYSPLYGKLWLAEIDEECEIITCYKHPLDKGCTRAILEQEDTVSFYSNGTTGLLDFSISKDCMLFLYDIKLKSLIFAKEYIINIKKEFDKL